MTDSWAHPVNGSWNASADWTGGVPAPGSTALITTPGTYTVTSSQNNSVGNLETAKKTTLAVAADAFDLTLGTGTGALAGAVTVAETAKLELGTDGMDTTFDNVGVCTLTGGIDPTELVVAGNATLAGKGKVELGPNSEIVSDGSTASLTNSNAISGQGTIGDSNLTFNNEAKAVVDANDVDAALFVSAEQCTNSGELESSNQGQLLLSGDISGGKSGKFVAGADSSIHLDGALIDGGAVSIGKGATLSTGGPFVNMINTTAAVKNAGEINANGADLEIEASVKNSGAGSLSASSGNLLEITGQVTRGTATIFGPGVINFHEASSTRVTFEPGGFGILVLGEPQKFTGTVAGMATDSQAYIDLGNIQFADNPVVSPLSSKGVLTVTDPVTHVVDKIKIIGGGTFMASGGNSDGSTSISDPPAASADPSPGNVSVLAQAMASFGAAAGAADSGTAATKEPHGGADLLAPPHH